MMGFVLGGAAGASAEEIWVSQDELRGAIERGLAVVQRSAAEYPTHRRCFSCHHQTLPMLAMKFTHDFFTKCSKDLRGEKSIGGSAMTVGYGLWALDIVRNTGEPTGPVRAFPGILSGATPGVRAVPGRIGREARRTSRARMESAKGRLLVVDDNAMNRDMLSRRLARRGYDVALADGGALALEKIASQTFDVVLLDIMMPDVDGMEVLRRVRQTHPATSLPIIMATAKGAKEDIVEALKAGANDYVTKPLDFAVVVARVETQLSLKRAVDQIVELERDLARRNLDLEKINHRMKRDLTAAALVQQALLPTSAPKTADVRFSWRYLPCDELGGDILNVFTLDKSHVGLYLLDVSGHGVPAALLSVTLSRMLTPVPDQPSLVRRRVENGSGFVPTAPSEVAAELNRRFPMDGRTGQYFTMLYGVLNLETHALRYVCAGHPGPVHVPATGNAAALVSPAYAIGWFLEAEYEEQTLELKPGDRLYFYSDGVSETRNADDEQFGTQRIITALGESAQAGLDESITQMLKAAEEWNHGGFDDDVSVLALDRTGAPS